MGKSRTVRYAVAATIEGPGVLTGPLEYPVKHCGKPSTEGLAKFVEHHNASLRPGGCNEHLGPASTITVAALYDHKGVDGPTLVATWSA